GLHAHQTMMDVTGNNIANVNTVGYKASSVQFRDTLSQMIGAAGAPQNGMGGTNPAQVGLGVSNNGIVANFAQGSQQTTGRSGDMMIQGDGFFVTRSGNEMQYTRAGSFTFDANGLLVSAAGEPVQGWTAKDGVVNSSAKPDDIRMPLGGTIAPKATENITLKGNLSTDAIPDGNNPPAGGSYDATTNPYKTQIPVKVFDESGATRSVLAEFARKDPDMNGWTVNLFEQDGTTPVAGTTSDVDLNFTGGRPDATDAPNGEMDFGPFTLKVADLTNFSGISDARVFDTDGQTSGALTSLSYSVSDTGQIVGVYSNGLKQVLGQVAMATFKNPTGLEKIGDSSFRSTVNSGYAQVGQPGSAGMGSVVTGALEMSNVDLAQEFTNLVIAQRGFQANSRIITTSDELLQELVSMKR
ncbi:MAG: flagellar hook protein FlgE, partial [Jiangellaceae bacterium]